MSDKRRCESHGCARIEAIDGQVHLWSTRRPESVAVLDADEWAALTDQVKAGNLDHLGSTA